MTVPVGSSTNVLSGLTFTGTNVGSNQIGVFSVRDTNATTTNVTTNVSVNVYGHASGSLATNAVVLQPVHVGYSNGQTSLIGMSNASGFRVAMNTFATNSGNLSLTGVSNVVAGGSGNATLSFATGQPLGAFTNSIQVTYSDASSLNGASSNVGVGFLSVSGLVYSGQSSWTAGGGNWSNFANWSSLGGTPGLDGLLSTNDTAAFGTGAGGVVSLNTNAVLNALSFSNASSYTVAGTGSISLVQGSLAPSVTTLGGSHLISNAVVLGTNAGVSNAAGTLLTLAGNVTGPGALSMAGGGTLALNASNGYTGGTVITGGTVAAGNANALGAGALSLGGGGGGSNAVLSVNVTGTVLNVGGDITLSGNTIIMLAGSGTNVNSVASLGGISLSGANNTIVLSGVLNATTYTYNLLSGTSLSGVNAGSITLSNAVFGNLAFGSTVISGTNSYTFTNNATSLELVMTNLANFSWSAGAKGNWDTNGVSTNWVMNGSGDRVAFVASNNAIFTNATTGTVTNTGGVASGVTVANSTGTVALGGGTVTASTLVMNGSGALVVSNALNVAGGFTASAGSSSLLFSNNTIGGGISLSGGARLIAGYNGSLGSGVLGIAGGTFAPASKATNLANPIVLGSGVDIITNAGSLTLGGAITGSGVLTKAGVGVLTLTGANTNYGGSFAVNAGTLAGNADSLHGDIALAGNTTKVLFNQTGNGEYSNNITGGGAVAITVVTPPNTNASTLLLSGNNSYNGGTTITGYVAGYAGSSLRGTIVNNGRVTFLNTNVASYVGNMSGTGAFVMGGSGTVVLIGTNTYKGGTTVRTNATLAGNVTSLQGNITNNGTVAFNQASTATYKGIVSGSGALVMNGIGNLSLGGLNTYSGGTFVTAGTLSGSVVNIPGAITLANNATIAFNQAGTAIETNPISGTGNLVKLGTGDLTLGATNNTYTGTTTVSAGTLVFTNGSSISNLGGSLVNNANLVLNTPFSSPGTFGGTLSGGKTAVLSKLGNGSVTLAGDNSAYLGTISITAGGIAASNLGTGALKLAGTTTSPVFTSTKASGALNAGSITLGGNSTLALANAATSIASSGTVTITGINFIALSGTWNVGTWALLTGTKLTGTGVAGLRFTGDTLGGGTATLGTSGAFTTNGFKYTFFTNATSVELTVANAISPASRMRVAAGEIRPAILTLPAPTPTPTPQPNYAAYAQNANQVQVATALTSFQSATTGDEKVIAGNLNTLASNGALPGAFNAIMPSLYQSLTTVAFNLANAQNMELAQRLWGLRVAGEGFSMNGFADNTPMLEGQGDGKSFKDPSKDILRPGAASHWGMFADANGIFANANSGNMLPGYNAQSGGITTGLTYKWNESFGTGIYAGYEGTYAKYSGGSSLIDNSVRFGVFATYGQKDAKGEALGFYANALAGGGYNNYSVTRNIAFPGVTRTANSSPGAGELDSMLGGGYDLRKGNFTYGPTASLQYTYLGVNPVNETGAQSLNFSSGGWNNSSMLSSVGAHAAYNWQARPNILVVPQVSLSWQHEFMQNPYAINGNLGGTSPAFSTTSATGTRDYLYTGVGFTVEFAKRWNTSLFYNAAAGNQNLQSQNIFWSAGIKF